MKRIPLLINLLFLISIAKAQEKYIHLDLEAQGTATTAGVVPFWLRSNQFGSVPLPETRGSFIGSFHKSYDLDAPFDWATSFEGRVNLGEQTQFELIEGFLKAHVGRVELKAGRSKDIIGLTDSTLSSGSFSISGNALGIPKISIGLPDYYSIPIWGKLFAIKGNFANGYLGNIGTQYGARPQKFKSYYLENSLYIQIGKPSWKLKIQGGFNHEAIWGDEKDVFGPTFPLSGAETYWYVLAGQAYNGSKVGNHLGSLDLGVQYQFDSITLFLYRQNLYDVGALSSLANLADGLNGLRLINNKVASSKFHWKKVLFEFLYTANQAGYINSKITKSGAENYYNNYEYTQGWSYKNKGLGIPFITVRTDARKSLPYSRTQFFINNRVMAYHVAGELSVFNWFYMAKISYSINYGTFASGSQPYRIMYGQLQEPDATGIFGKANQLSTFIEGVRPLKGGYKFGYDIGYDHGGVLYNSFGLILKLSKSFL